MNGDQEQLKAVGISVKLEPVAQSDWYPRVVQLAINFTPMRWSQRPDPDGLMSLLFHSKGAGNSTKYSNPEVDRLIDQARTLTEQSERAAAYQKAQEVMMADLPYIPLFFSLEYAAMRDGERARLDRGRNSASARPLENPVTSGFPQ